MDADHDSGTTHLSGRRAVSAWVPTLAKVLVAATLCYGVGMLAIKATKVAVVAIVGLAALVTAWWMFGRRRA